MLVLAPGATLANIEVQFVESAPKDRFVVLNSGDCDVRDVVLEVDLEDTRGKLVFDTSAGGTGVEVFQPFEIRTGDFSLESAGQVGDGDNSLSIRIGSLPVGEQLSFTIDVDDTLTNSALGQIRVAGTEMENGRVTLIAADGKSASAKFDATSLARIVPSICNGA